MTEPTNADIIRELAVLGANQANLTKLVEEEKRGAREHRDEMRNRMGSVERDLRAVGQDVAEMVPKVNRLEENRLMAAGAGKLAQWLSKGLYAFVGLLGGLATWAMQKFFS